MRTITAMNLKTKKYERITNSGLKDDFGKVIWVDGDGNAVELTTSRHFGRTNYYFARTGYQIENA